RKARLRAMADDGNRAARRVLALAESPGGFLATIQVGITLAGFFASAVGAVSLVKVVEDWLEGVPLGFVAGNASAVGLILVTAVLSFVSIVLGELVPKTLAVSRAEPVALRVVGPIETLSRIAHPIVSLLTGTTNAILRLIGSHRQANLPSITHAEILAMVEAAEDEGVVEQAEAELVEEALEFGRIVVRSVMVPRVDVRAIEGGTSLGTAVDLFFSTGYSRLPVFRETPDDILGILHVKDVFRLLWMDREVATKPVAEVIRPAYFVPESKPIDELLQELRARSTHIAIIVDEYGGMAGLVTLEDLIEELVGEITDEFDAGYEPLREVEPDVVEADGRVSVGDLLDLLDIERHRLEPFEAESVGGLIADRLGRIPELGDVVETGPLRFEVRSMDGYRVALVRVERIDQRASDATLVEQRAEGE
ncbi:MAG: magnesium and cobalt exporter, family, partial [Thermomicrobiales bacterium]|nr:magnesium and cobalt exporter, family [Thermomicrobiales bacterium]